MAFYVEKEEEWYIATDLETKVSSQGKTAAEACSNLEEALELYKDCEKEGKRKGDTLAERLITKMNAYVERLRKMPPEEAEKEATECLKKSGILLENGELNEAMFQPSKYISSEMFDSMCEDEQKKRIWNEIQPTPDVIAEGMRQYLEELKKNPDKEEARRSLIRTGVLDENGQPKKQICNGGYYVGN